MRNLIVALTLSPSILFAQLECDPEQLARSCYTALCSTRTSVPDSVENLRADIRASGLKNLDEISPTITNYRRTIEQLQARLASQPATDEALTNRFLRDVNASAVEVTTMVGRYRSTTASGETVYSNTLPPAEREIVERIDRRILGDQGGIAIFDLTNFDLPLEQNQYNETGLRQIREFIRTTRPERSADYDEYLRLRLAAQPISEELKNRLNLTEIGNAYTRTLYQREMPSLLAFYRNYEKDLLSNLPAQLERKADRCQIADYLTRKVRQTNTRERFRPMVANVLRAVQTRFYPRLSQESARTLSRELTADKFHLLNETASAQEFNIDTSSVGPTPDRPDTLRALSELANVDCRISVLSRASQDAVSIDPETRDLTIEISPLTMAQGEESVIAHEVGHFITQSMATHPLSTPSMQKIVALRNCLKDMHPAETRASVIPDSVAGDELYTDEDFGDWMSATLGYDGDYMGCDIGRMLDMGKTLPPSLVAVENDNHSSDLFRQLHMRTLRNQSIPQDCRELIQVTPEHQPKKCEL